MKSVRSLGALSTVVLIGSGVSALSGNIGLAICLVATCAIIVLGMFQLTERRRHADHRQVIHSLALIRKKFEANNDSLLRLQKQQLDSLGIAIQETKALQEQHSKSLGLTFREVKSIQTRHLDSLGQTFGEITALQEQHSKSLGLIFREVKVLSAELTGEDPFLEEYAERQLATYLNALRITKREILEAAVPPKSVNTLSGRN
jgi:hypothetical protein